jgi:predicted MFS family arabinose efflux permease|tara:strand:+ start:114 stop:443 length:330 start_codon:yes stop_codon:yes gene_type:complete
MDILQCLPDGLIFGMIDNLFLIVGVLFGLTYLESFIEHTLKTSSRSAATLLGGILGGGIGNTISDYLGCLGDPVLIDSIWGITIGTQLPLLPAYVIWLALITKQNKKGK